MESRHDDQEAVFSPDGQWVAYQSNESGQNEVYVRAIVGGARWQVSAGGGQSPRWPRPDHIIYYANNRLMRVRVTTSPAFSASAAEIWMSDVPGRDFDVARGGGLVIQHDATMVGADQLNVVVNWLEEFRTLIAADKTQ